MFPPNLVLQGSENIDNILSWKQTQKKKDMDMQSRLDEQMELIYYKNGFGNHIRWFIFLKQVWQLKTYVVEFLDIARALPTTSCFSNHRKKFRSRTSAYAHGELVGLMNLISSM